jgi:hypothetical protein
MYDVKFMNTYNSVISLRSIIKLAKPEDYYLEKESSNTYLENNKVPIHNYDNFKTEFILNNNLVFCYASINNYKILFNVLQIDDIPFVRNPITFDKSQLSSLQTISKTEILGEYTYYNRSAFPMEFIIINTCDCFNNYCKNNNWGSNKGARVKLIATFKESLTTSVLDDDPSEKSSKVNGYEFTFIHFYNLIIIIDYNKII